MVIIFYTRNVNYFKVYSVLAETFYLGFITFYVYALCIYIMGFCGLLLVFVYAALVNTIHGLIGYGM
jgi:uncharacterized membrane protein